MIKYSKKNKYKKTKKNKYRKTKKNNYKKTKKNNYRRTKKRKLKRSNRFKKGGIKKSHAAAALLGLGAAGGLIGAAVPPIGAATLAATGLAASNVAAGAGAGATAGAATGLLGITGNSLRNRFNRTNYNSLREPILDNSTRVNDSLEADYDSSGTTSLASAGHGTRVHTGAVVGRKIKIR